MKKIICLIALGLIIGITPTFAAPPAGGGGRPMGGPQMGGGMHRPPMGGAMSRPPMGGGMNRPPMGRPPMHGSVSIGMPPRPIGYHRPMPPMYRPIVRPYYGSRYYAYYPYYPYYPTYYSSYSYYPYATVVMPVPATTGTVVVQDNYAGINTTANVINAAANVAATIRYLTW